MKALFIILTTVFGVTSEIQIMNPQIIMIIDGKESYNLNNDKLEQIELPKTIQFDTEEEIVSTQITLTGSGRLLWRTDISGNKEIRIPALSKVSNLVLKIKIKDKKELIYSVPIK